MAKITITTEDGKVIETQGKMTFELNRNEDDEILCVGHIAIHEYIEGIQSIETFRYLLKDVEVYREVFGSNDFNILYEFNLNKDTGDFVIKEEALTEDQIEIIKLDEFCNEDCTKWE